MTTMTPDDYRNIYWSMLRDAIDQLLTLAQPSVPYYHTYDQLNSAVFKCVSTQYSEQLYSDLLNHVKTRLAQWSKYLTSVGDDAFINEFHKALVQYFRALGMGGIVSIFTHLDRFYIKAKLDLDLKKQLIMIFSDLVTDPHMARLIPLMVTAQAQPFCIPPAVMSTMCKHLYQLNPDYIRIQPRLFSSYLPNVVPKMNEEDLQAQKEADRVLQESLRTQGWGCSVNMSSTRKRDQEGHNVVPKMNEEDLQARKEAERLLQESLRAQGWGNSDNKSSARKRDLEDASGTPELQSFL